MTAPKSTRRTPCREAKLITRIAPNPDVVRTLHPGLTFCGELFIVVLTGDTPINLDALVTKWLSIRGVAPDSED